MSSSSRCYPLTGTFKITSPYGKRPPPKTNKGQGSSDHLGIDMVAKGDNPNLTVVSASNAYFCI